MKRILFTAAFGLSFFAITSAFAAEAYVTGNVALRAGPDSSYPRVAMLRAGTPVAVQGCVDGWSWCDVATAYDRGWVAGDFLQQEYQGERVLVPRYGVQIGIPIVSFVFGSYWNDYYSDRSWYRERERWSRVRPHYRPAAVRDGSYGNSHERSYGDSRRVSPRDAGASYVPGNRARDESRRSGVATTRASLQDRSSNTLAPRRPATTNVRSPERQANRARPMQRDAAVSRTPMPRAVTEPRATQPRAVATQRAAQPRANAEHRAARPQASRQKAQAKSAPKQENGKDKD